MRNNLKMTSMVCAVALVTACQTTTPSSNYLHADARPHIKTMDSVMFAPQYKVDTNIKTSKVSQFMPIHIAPILFDIGMNTMREVKANQYVKPIHETLENYDFAYDIREEFNLALEDSGMGGAGDLKMVRREQPGVRAAMIRKSDADAVMFIDVKYAFSPSFDSLNLTSGVFVYPVNSELNDYKEIPDKDGIIEYSDNIYRNQFRASVPVAALEAGEDKRKTSENAALWAAMSEEELTDRLQEAAAFLASHIASDMNTDEVEEVDTTPRPVDPNDDHDEFLSKKPLLIDATFTEADSAS